MKILVPTKRVPDPDQKILASADGSCVAVDGVSYTTNPFDAVALEESVRIAEQLHGSVEVVVVGIGNHCYEQQLRTALATGADRAIHVQCAQSLDPWNIARLLHAVVGREQPQLVIMGKQAADDDANQTGQFLAALLDWPQATFASRVALSGGILAVDRDTDHGIETIRLPLPAVVTAGLRLNEPRYATMTSIRNARTKPLEILAIDDLGVSIEPRVSVVRYHSVDSRRGGERVDTVDELVERLARCGAALHHPG